LPRQRRSSENTSIVLEGLKEIEDRIEGLIETYEITSDKRLLREIQASLKEAQKGEGRPISEIISDLEKMTKG
jgi:hypothetical protein